MWNWSGDQRVMAREGLAERVDRRGTDIAEHDADRADRELVQRALRVAVRAYPVAPRLRRLQWR